MQQQGNPQNYNQPNQGFNRPPVGQLSPGQYPPTRNTNPQNRPNFQQNSNPAYPNQRYPYPEQRPRPPKPQIKQKTEAEYDRYYLSLLTTAIIAILMYYVGASMIIFVRNVGGEQIVILPTNEVFWELLFTNFWQFVRNIFMNIFGYFIQYAKLFGYFEETGELSVDPRPKYMLPLDLLIKGAAIAYFHFYWMRWDTKQCIKRACFNAKYPYFRDDMEKLIEELKLDVNPESVTSAKNIQATKNQDHFDDDEDTMTLNMM